MAGPSATRPLRVALRRRTLRFSRPPAAPKAANLHPTTGKALAVATPIAGLAVWRFGLDGAAAGYVTAHLLLATLLLWRTRHVLHATPGAHGMRAQQPGVAHG